MVLAAKFVSSCGYNTVSIQALDSDVAILSLHYALMLSKPLYTKIGAGKNEIILNNTEVPLERNFLRALFGLRIILECDSTNAFHGMHGTAKRTWLNIVQGNEDYCNVLGLLVENLQIDDPLFDVIEYMVYQASGFLNKPNVSDVRYEKSCWEKFPEPSKITPTKD